MTKTDIHADDYALTVNTSKDMLECMKAGKLDSISIVPNTSAFGQCMEMLCEQIPSLPFLPLMSVHLDFVEGRSLAGRGEAPMLTRKDSDLMGLSWGGLFKLSYLPWKRREAKKQLKKEIKAQIAKTQRAVEQCMELAKKAGIPCAQKGLRIDSHQHSHMIPVVWEAVTEVVAEENYPLEYIRNSKEVLGVFLSEPSLWRTYRPINFVKNRILALYSHKADRYARAHGMEQMYLWGLVMSGRMDADRVGKLYGKMTAKAAKDGRILEILFHPGITLEEEVNEEIGDEAAEEFYLSQNRRLEKAAVLSGAGK
jgi:predicted glycoside hydrolase/deacetylase ChbG (UPF0249 family)